ncbi:hypothetical protein, partial [Escherichia coli]|uniref:hypothetical protein n=1 Tax=Escherichia coli TaxID=562 RepID=UPI001953146F
IGVPVLELPNAGVAGRAGAVLLELGDLPVERGVRRSLASSQARSPKSPSMPAVRLATEVTMPQPAGLPLRASLI